MSSAELASHKTYFPVVIVGGGPAGLALGYRLQQAGLKFIILEKETVAWSWQNHYENLALHTPKGISALPGRPIPAEWPEFLPRRLVVTYLRDYAAHFRLNVREHTPVTRACFDRESRLWTIATPEQMFTSRVLVAATGIWSTPHVPHFPGEESFQGEIFHAQGYRQAEPYTGRRVLVVGGGNTGTELAVEIAAVAAYTKIAIRGGVTFAPYPTAAWTLKAAAWLFRHLPASWVHRLLKRRRPDFRHMGLEPPPGYLTDAYPVIGFELPEAVEAGQVEVYPGGLERLTPAGVVFDDGTAERFDTIILATGYRPSLQFIDPAELPFDGKGWPLLDDRWRSVRNKQLICIGYSYPNTEGWLQSIPRFSKEAVAAIVEQITS